MARIPALLFYIFAVSVSFIEGDVKPEKRIIGGENASPHEFPHQVFLFNQQTERAAGTCGGSLLTPEWVLTAAHCATENNLGLKFLIIAGTHSNPLANEGESVQPSSAKEVFVHPCWLGDLNLSPYNDIALIKLNKPIFLDENAKTIQIDEIDRAKPGTQTITIGWGRTDATSADTARVLKKATIPLPAAGVCEKLVPGIDVGSQQCSNGKDSVCDGDSGGPLLCKDGGVNFVCGITSFGKGESCVGGFNVFVRVFHYRNWIKEVMRRSCNNELDCVDGKRPAKSVEMCGDPKAGSETTTKANVNANTDTPNANTREDNSNTDSLEDSSKTDSRGTKLYGQALYELFIGMILITLP